MKIRKEHVILAVVIAALCGYLVWQRQKQTAYRLPALPAVARAEITRIQIERPGEAPLELKKDKDAWRVGAEAYAADPDRVNGMLEIIEGLTLTALVSEAGQYERYQLDPAGRIRVRAWAGEQLKRDFAIGKSAPTYRHTFVTVQGDANVYHARDDFRGRFDRDLDQMREKSVMAFKREEIRTVRLTVGSETPVVFTRPAPPAVTEPPKDAKDAAPKDAAQKPAEPQWQDAAGKAADGQTLDNLLSSLSSLECERYLYDRTKADLEAGKPEYTIEVDGDRPRRLVLFADGHGGKEKKEKTGISSENDHPFVVSAFFSQELAEQIAKLTGKTREAAPKKAAKAK